MGNATSESGVIGSVIDRLPKRRSTFKAPRGSDIKRVCWSFEELPTGVIEKALASMPEVLIEHTPFDELAEKAQAILAPLPELNRAIMIARHVESLGWKEIAMRFKISMGQARAEEKFARTMLKSTLGQSKNIALAGNDQIH